MQKPASLTLYSLVSYDRSAKVRWLLTEMGVAFDEVRMNREKKEHEGPEYLRINPLGRVPAMRIDDQVVFESNAICATLADRYPEKGMSPGLDSPLRAEFNQWMHFASATLDSMQTRIMVIEDIPAGEIQKTKEAALQSDLHDAVSALDRVLARQEFLVGGKFSTADIAVAYPLYFCAMWPELNVEIEKFPRVVAYVERLKKMPSAVRAEVFTFPA